MYLTEAQKIGLGLIFFGFLFISFGILLLFDTGLLAIGNIMLLAGGVLFFGVDKTRTFLLQPGRWKGTACFFAGILLILCRWTKIGFLLEIFGFLNLFADLFPLLGQLGMNVPVVRDIMELPLIKKFMRSSTPPPV